MFRRGSLLAQTRSTACGLAAGRLLPVAPPPWRCNPFPSAPRRPGLIPAADLWGLSLERDPVWGIVQRGKSHPVRQASQSPSAPSAPPAQQSKQASSPVPVPGEERNWKCVREGREREGPRSDGAAVFPPAHLFSSRLVSSRSAPCHFRTRGPKTSVAVSQLSFVSDPRPPTRPTTVFFFSLSLFPGRAALPCFGCAPAPPSPCCAKSRPSSISKHR